MRLLSCCAMLQVLIVTAVFADEPLPAAKAAILAHGPWPNPATRDSGNRASGSGPAAALGQRLFFDRRLSANRRIACASCHQPHRAWTDGRARAKGIRETARNTLSLLNVANRVWFGWDGANDSLWAQSLRPLTDPREMGLPPDRLVRLVADDPEYRCRYREAFGSAVPADPDALLVNVAKALAAFQETLISARTPFDEFRDALARGDYEGMAAFPAAARRGLALFVGRAKCNICHYGPNFSNGEFAEIGVPYFVPGGGVDAGRHEGIRKLLASPYNRLGRYDDAASPADAGRTRHVVAQHRNFGEFRVPSLRDVGRTAPYMHDGSLKTLHDVLRHYSELDAERLHADGTELLRAMHFTEDEMLDLEAFLHSLDSYPTSLPPPPAACRQPPRGAAR